MFRLVQCLAHVAVVGSGEPADPAHHRLPVVGEVQGVLPPVSAAAFPAQEAAFCKVVDETDDPAGQQAQLGGELLLTAAGVAGDRSEQSGQWRIKPDLGDAFGEAGRGMCTELSQQECGPTGAPRAWVAGVAASWVSGNRHALTLSNPNRSCYEWFIAVTTRRRIDMAVLDENHQADELDNHSPQPQRHAGGAPLLPPVIAYVVLAVAGVIAPPAVAGQAPYTSDANLLDFYAHHSGAAHLLAFLVLASAVPYAVLTAIASHRVRAAGLDVPGRLIALVGGTAAAVLLALSGLASLALTQPHVAESPEVVRAVSGLAFAAGGPGFVVFSGLLVAGISVPALIGRLTPRWVGWFGLAVAVVCELASFSAATDALILLLPIGRFATMSWLLGLAVTLSARPSAKQR